MSEKKKKNLQNPSAAQDDATVKAQDVTPKKKSKAVRVILTIIEVICLVAMVISGYFVVKFFVDEYMEEEESRKHFEEIGDESDQYDPIVIIDPNKPSRDPSSGDDPDPNDPTGSEGTESAGGESSDTPEDNPKEPFVLKYLTGKSLKKANAKSVPKQIVGWFEMTGYASAKIPPEIKKISQPVAQGTDNAYYLSHDAYGAEKDYGAVYVDCRCDMDDLLNNKNIVVYAHAKSSSRFGIVKSLNKCQEWIDTEAYHYIYLQTEKETTIWRIFSWYTTDKDAAYRNTKFTDDDAFVDYCNSLQKKNKIKSLEKYDFSPDDVIMTLSTCKGMENNIRVAAHAVLISHAYLEDLKK